MSNVLQLKRNTATAGKIPSTLAVGELATNAVDATLFVGANSGVVQIGGSQVDNSISSSVIARAPSQAAVWSYVNRRKTVAVTANYSVVADDYFIVSDATSAITITLPSASSVAGQELFIKRRGSGVVTVSGTNLDGGTTAKLNAPKGFDALWLIAQGGAWNLG